MRKKLKEERNKLRLNWFSVSQSVSLKPGRSWSSPGESALFLLVHSNKQTDAPQSSEVVDVFSCNGVPPHVSIQ